MEAIPENNVVKWSGTHFGYVPDIPPSVMKMIEDKAVSNQKLLEALAHRDKFVIAHVMLTLISKVQYETFPTWNKLKIEMLPDGDTSIDAQQRFYLREYWNTVLKF